VGFYMAEANLTEK